MSWISKYFYSQGVFPYAARALEYITGTVVYAGTFLFYYLEKAYIRDFDSKHRQHRLEASLNNTDSEESRICDWENPEVVGRNKTHAHTVLRSFTSVEAALNFWVSSVPNEEVACNKLFLTGAAGEPDALKVWMFHLVGSVELAPSDWQHFRYAPRPGLWKPIALPGHWQCQGFDIPIYTNTVYPVCCHYEHMCITYQH